MLLSEFQTKLHELYQLDTSVPASTEEDYTIRTNLLETAINLWAHEEGVTWRELWTTASGTTGAGSTIPLSSFTDFIFPGGFLRIKLDGTNWTYVPIVDQAKSELFKNMPSGNNANAAWITGNKKTGFTVNLTFTVSSGLSWELPYYKDPFIPSSASDVIEMSDPFFAIYYALSKLHENDGEGDRATLALQLADSRLKGMKFLNGKAPNYQENYVPDRDLELGTPGFGL